VSQLTARHRFFEQWLVRRDDPPVGRQVARVLARAQGPHRDRLLALVLAERPLPRQCRLGWAACRLEPRGASRSSDQLSPRRPISLTSPRYPRQTGEPIRQHDTKTGIFEIDWNEGAIGVCRSDKIFSIVSVQDLP